MATNDQHYAKTKVDCFIRPRANDVIRHFFLTQWRKYAKEEWQNTPDQGKAFVTGVGRRAWTTSSCRQKTLLECGRTSLWDLGLCNHVLQKTDSSVTGLSERKKTLLNELAMLQNDVNRNSQAMSNDEHVTKIKRFQDILEQYELSVQDRVVINALIFTESENESAAYRMNKEANSLFNENKLQEALRRYNELIEMTGVPKKLLGEVYSNRSAIYRFIGDGKHTAGLSLEDAKRVVQLVPDWFSGYFRLGSAYYRLGKHEKAFKYFSIALELQPDETDIIPLRDECEKNIPEPKSPREILLRNEIRNYHDLADSINARCETLVTPIGLTAILNSANKSLPEYYLVSAIYSMGFGGPLDYKHIFRLLNKSAENNTLALFYIAIMYELGVGVEIDLKQCIRFLKHVASGMKSPDCFDGVALAENYLACMYAKGIGLPVDLEESVRLYRRACHNGSGFGALNLGLRYLDGTGVECNEDIGLAYVKLAAKRFNADAALFLAEYYLVDGEDAEQAMEWHRCAISRGSLVAFSKTNEFEAEVRELKSKFDKFDEEIRNLELVSGLGAEGLSMKRRRERFLKNSSPVSGKFYQKVSEMGYYKARGVS